LETRTRLKRAMIRAYDIPDYKQAQAAVLEIHADLLHCNRSAAHILEQDLEKTLTLHQTENISKLSRSLRSTRCLVGIEQKANRRVKEIQRWLKPTDRRAQIALALLEIEMGLRKLDHASTLPVLLPQTPA